MKKRMVYMIAGCFAVSITAMDITRDQTFFTSQQEDFQEMPEGEEEMSDLNKILNTVFNKNILTILESPFLEGKPHANNLIALILDMFNCAAKVFFEEFDKTDLTIEQKIAILKNELSDFNDNKKDAESKLDSTLETISMITSNPEINKENALANPFLNRLTNVLEKFTKKQLIHGIKRYEMVLASKLQSQY